MNDQRVIDDLTCLILMANTGLRETHLDGTNGKTAGQRNSMSRPQRPILLASVRLISTLIREPVTRSRRQDEGDGHIRQGEAERDAERNE